jgi:hypothetical protein
MKVQIKALDLSRLGILAARRWPAVGRQRSVRCIPRHATHSRCRRLVATPAICDPVDVGKAQVVQVSPDELVRALRRIAAKLDRPLSARDVPLGLWRALLREFGSVAAAREAARLPGPLLNYRWSEDSLLDEIRRLARSGVRIVHQDLKDAGREDVLGAITGYFGSIVSARRLARVPDPPRKTWVPEPWDEERVVAMILERCRAGEPLASSKVPARYVAAGIRYFGSWPAAIEASGLNYDDVRLRRAEYTRSELLALLRELPRKRPDMSREDLFALSYQSALVRHFGSIDNALRRAGLDDWPPRVREQTLSPDTVIKMLRTRRREGESTTVMDVKTDSHLLWFSAMVHFGDWDGALAAAKLERDSVQRSYWTREMILDELRARHERGESLRTTTVLREAPALYHAAKKHFGGYVTAAREIDGAPWATIDWSRDRVIVELQGHARAGGQLTQLGVGSALANACERYFGGMRKACRAAGLR